MKKQEDAYATKTATLTKKSEEGGVVSRNKAKNELAQHLAEDPLPLRQAKITAEAAVCLFFFFFFFLHISPFIISPLSLFPSNFLLQVRKAEKATKAAAEAREKADEDSAKATEARAAAVADAEAAKKARAAAEESRAAAEADKVAADAAVDAAQGFFVLFRFVLFCFVLKKERPKESPILTSFF